MVDEEVTDYNFDSKGVKEILIQHNILPCDFEMPHYERGTSR